VPEAAALFDESPISPQPAAKLAAGQFSQQAVAKFDESTK